MTGYLNILGNSLYILNCGAVLGNLLYIIIKARLLLKLLLYSFGIATLNNYTMLNNWLCVDRGALFAKPIY